MTLILWTLVCTLIFLLGYFLHQNMPSRLETKGSAAVVYLGNSLFRALQQTLENSNPLANLLRDYNTIKSFKAKLGLRYDFSSSRHLIISDLDLLKQIFLINFDHFTDRFHFEGTKSDPVTHRSLFTKRGEEWKAVRTTLSPTFSSRNIKMFYRKFDKTGQRMVDYVLSSGATERVFQVDKVLSKYSMDLIASITYGIDCKAFDTREDELSHFETMAQRIQFHHNFLTVCKHLILRLSTKLADILSITVFNQEAINYFWDVGKHAIDSRQQSQPSNLVELMIHTTERKGFLEEDIEEDEQEFIINHKTSGNTKGLKLSTDDIAANSIVFILGGYDTTMVLNKMSLYCLAKFPSVQQRLYKEIHTVLEQNGQEEFTYEVVSQMEHLTLFVNEVLRMYPPGVGVERICTKTLKVNDTLTISKGDRIYIPIYAFHHDSQYFQNPNEFDPDRFSKERRADIPPYAFMPFGHGPRNCIGFRMAVAQSKIAIAHFVKNFEISLANDLLDKELNLSVTSMSSLVVNQPISVHLKLRRKT